MPSLVDEVVNAFMHHDKKSVFTIAISGIDASGKGYISKLLQEKLETIGYKVANINIDSWQNPLPVRLKKENAAENFYRNVFRWDDFFTQLIIPLRKTGSIYLATRLIRTDADEYYSFTYDLKEIDILIIEGILLFQKHLLSHYDLKVWIDCSFENGMQRAISRNVEHLSEQQLIHDYNTYYYPAQHYHLQKDNPISLSDIIYYNDGIVSHVAINSQAPA